MIKITLSLLVLTCLAITSPAQQRLRYRDLIFNSSIREKNILYDSAALNSKRHRLDIYTPAGDTVVRRPVIVLFHGGGFKFGSKNNSRMKIWGRRFARMGYVCVAMNYTLSRKRPLSRFEDLAEACLVATADVEQAEKWLTNNSDRLGIDPLRMVLGGHSAGGMLALHSVYADMDDLAGLVQRYRTDTSARLPGPGKVPPKQEAHSPRAGTGIIGIINFWGAIYDTTWLGNARVPIVSVHGSKDRVVPYNYGESPVFGSAAIHRVAERQGIINSLKTYPAIGHELQKHFNPLYAGPIARKRWRGAADFAATFVQKLL